MIGEIVCAPTLAALHEAGALAFAVAAADAVGARGIFNVALAGGATPKGAYALLASDPAVRRRVVWDRVRFFWGDERHVPPDHPDSNYRMAKEALLDPLAIDGRQVCRIRAEYPEASRAADEYERDLMTMFALEPGHVPRFDLILLGMGEDGHTASLFPGTSAVHERRRLAVANHVPKLDTERITLTAPVLNNAADVVFLIHGVDKAPALKAVLEGPYQPDQRPAQLVRPTDGRLRWIIDPAAASLLSDR